MRVRTRLVLSVAVVGLTVLGAGAPAAVSVSAELNESQRLVTLADHTRQTLALAHALSDERDAAVAFVADGRPGAGKAAVQDRAARVDQQIGEARPEAGADLERALGRVPAVRTATLTGKGSALAAHLAYSEVIGELLKPAGELAERTPPRADTALATARALDPLGRAVDQASATRGLLLAALAVPEGPEQVPVYNPDTGRYEEPGPSPEDKARDELTAAAQRARVREQAALEDFTRAARPDVRETLTATVTGPEVKAAEGYLDRLTDRATLTSADRKLDGEKVAAALTARIDRMRSVEATLAAERATALAALRDDDVTELEVLLGLVGLLLLIAVGVSTGVARTLTRPLSVLKRGAERLASPEGAADPVRFIGRNDEFAAVVRSLNAMQARNEAQSTALHTRIAGLDDDRSRLIERNDTLSAAKTALDKELAELRANLEEYRRVLSTTSVSLSLRTLGLVERQLAVIEQMEAKEQDPDRLATLFKVDHLATVMRRHNENLLVLAGQEHGHGQAGPVPLVDVMRAAVSEIERYERVELQAMPVLTQVAGHAADDISHVVAELLENATTFSPPEARVKVAAWLLDDGDIVVSVQDEGIGVTGDRLADLNRRLSDPDAYEHEEESEHGLGLGLYVAGRLAARHGVTAELRARQGGGTEGLVVIPAALLPAAPVAPEHTLSLPDAPALRLPGVIAEANSNVIPPRRRPDRDQAAPAEPSAGQAPAAEEPVAEAPFGDEPVTETAFAEEPAAQAAFAGEPAVEAGVADEPAADERFAQDAFAPDAVPEAQASADRAAPDPAPVHGFAEAGAAGFAEAARPQAADGPLPSAGEVFRVPAQASGEPAPEAAEELPPAAQVFRMPAAEPEAHAFAEAGSAPQPAGPEATGPVVSRRQVFDVPAPAEEPLPPAGQVFRVPAPEPAAEQPQDGADPDGAADSDGWVLAAPLPRRADAGEQEADVRDETDEDAYRLTDKGLPKRTPRVVEPAPTDERKTAPRVDAEELRRRLGGFYQGARDGRRVADAEHAERAKDEGDTVEEART
ncbi:nitrate- and nitrite sensing domain-containing protein [Streptomyces bambusae]|uniref:nitrate- and nitrite sensing domain-containing protein n=1 Tax=Streptomyces bambusae TaxID=1550616 RepID=UPI001CFEF640|nr:nitrate- and nitrite sensing domain-containing protein [Streptomyces bambusae]MCB5165090.1 nitrate- and nitrite sensing domain-containing protein [Streptomyces bambusae]